jgi:hypothetical protein
MIDHLRPLIPSLAAGAVLVPVFLALKSIPALSGSSLARIAAALVLTIPATAFALLGFPSGRALMRDSVRLLGARASRAAEARQGDVQVL